MNTRILYAVFAAGFLATAYFIFVTKSFELAIIASIITFASAFMIFVGHARMGENTEIHCGRL
jgi:hypothetical protein